MAKKERYSFKQWCIDNNKIDLLGLWDYEKTGFAPEDITYASAKPVYFKCPNGIHESGLRYVHRITCKNDQSNFRCKECFKEHPIIKDISGQIFGELTVIEPDFEATQNHSNHGTYWKCICSCGSVVSVFANSLKDGRQVTCGDRSIHRKGENNSNWKGGITPILLSERTSKEYNSWRDEVYSNNWYTCQCCGKYGDDINKNAHHINNFSEYDEMKYDVKNGILLCEECHHIRRNGSFHNVYGTHNNTAQQLEQYINNKRQQLGINIPFTIDSYLSGNILRPGDVNKSSWIFDMYSINELRDKSTNQKIRTRFAVA